MADHLGWLHLGLLSRGSSAAAAAYTAAAHELGQLNLADALALCLLLRDQHPLLHERASTRWVARLALEARAMTLADLDLAVAALRALRGSGRDAGAEALAALCERHGQLEAVDVLERWTRASDR